MWRENPSSLLSLEETHALRSPNTEKGFHSCGGSAATILAVAIGTRPAGSERPEEMLALSPEGSKGH